MFRLDVHHPVISNLGQLPDASEAFKRCIISRKKTFSFQEGIQTQSNFECLSLKQF